MKILVKDYTTSMGGPLSVHHLKDYRGMFDNKVWNTALPLILLWPRTSPIIMMKIAISPRSKLTLFSPRASLNTIGTPWCKQSI